MSLKNSVADCENSCKTSVRREEKVDCEHLEGQEGHDLVWQQIFETLACVLCGNLVSDACTLPCRHHVCNGCMVTRATTCPRCSTPFWPRDLQRNSQINNISVAFKRLVEAVFSARSEVMISTQDIEQIAQEQRQIVSALQEDKQYVMEFEAMISYSEGSIQDSADVSTQKIEEIVTRQERMIQQIDHQIPKKRIVVSGIADASRYVVEQAVECLGHAQLEDDIRSGTTHVIVGKSKEARLAKRTMKYLQGLAVGAWLLSIDWITECIQANEWVHEEAFQFVGDSGKATTYAPRQCRIDRVSPIHGLVFRVVGDYNPPFPSAQEISSLIRFSGAEERHLDSQKVDMIIGPPDMYLEEALNEAGKSPQPVVSVIWILDSISSWKRLSIDEYRLDVD